MVAGFAMYTHTHLGPNVVGPIGHSGSGGLVLGGGGVVGVVQGLVEGVLREGEVDCKGNGNLKKTDDVQLHNIQSYTKSS